MCLVSFDIFRNVSDAISWTPGCFSCMNSFSFFITVLRNGQCPVKKFGNYPTTYMISAATSALCVLPCVFSHRFSSSLTTETTNLFSSSPLMQPDIEPSAQQSLLSRSKLKNVSLFLVKASSRFWMHLSIPGVSILVRKTIVSLIRSYTWIVATSSKFSTTASPCSSVTTRTSFGLAIVSTSVSLRPSRILG